MIEPDLYIMESYGVLVGCTLVDASDWSASVLLVNPGADVVVLPLFSCVGTLVPVSAVSFPRAVMIVPETAWTLPDHLEYIFAGSHPSLGEDWRATLWTIKYAHVFPAPGEPVTGRTTAFQHY